MLMRVARLAGIVVALAALGGGFYAANRVTADARTVAALEAAQHTEKQLGEVAEAVSALPAQLIPVAKSAAAAPGLSVLIGGDTDYKSLEDFMRTEAGWKPYVVLGSTGVYFGEQLKASTGSQLDVEAAVDLAHTAQGSGAASAFVVGEKGVLLAGAAKASTTPNGVSTSVVIARPLKEKDLEPIATRYAIALSISGPKGAAVSAGTATLRSLLGQDDAIGTVSRVLGDGVKLHMASDVSSTMAKADQTSATPRTIAWVLAALLAMAALAFAFAPRPQGELLYAAAQELARSREEVSRLSAKITSSQSLDGSAAALTPLALENELGATSRTQLPAPAPRYQILGQLGEGGMAKVYVAISRGAEGFQRSFVIKRLRAELVNNAEAVNQFIDEGRLGASLVHSNIVPVLDFGRDAEGYYLAQEYILGRSIDRMVEESVRTTGGPLGPAVVLYLAHEALKALAYAHAKANDDGQAMGLVHRDVSPSNLMVSEQGEVKLLDFGIVKSDQRLTKTQAGMVKGNLFFMSPEQAKGLQVDARSDLFSLGMVLLNALRGTTLYSGTTSFELLNRAAAGLTEADLGLVRATSLGALLEKALKSEVAERYTSADDFARAVASAGTAATAAGVGALVKELFGAELAHETAQLRAARGQA